MEIFALEHSVYLLIAWVLLVLKIFAFSMSLMYSDDAYRAADKLNKATWCIILGVALVLQFFSVTGMGGMGILNIAGTIAMLVFLVDVRPALAGLRRR